jgi:hypothetical protein
MACALALHSAKTINCGFMKKIHNIKIITDSAKNLCLALTLLRTVRATVVTYCSLVIACAGQQVLPGILVLNQTDQHSLQVIGGASLNLGNTASVIVDSQDSRALLISGGSSITANNIFVTGHFQSSGGSTLTPTPLVGQPPLADPLVFLPPPSIAGLPTYNIQNLNGPNTVVTLQPGIYTDRLTISGGATVTFSPGIYVLNKGLDVFGSSTINGADVMLYNIGGQINISGDTLVNVSPPSSGMYMGITMFQDRNNPTTVNLAGRAASLIAGTYYFPAAQVQLSGGSDLKFGSIIAWTMLVSGGSYESVSN